MPPKVTQPGRKPKSGMPNQSAHDGASESIGIEMPLFDRLSIAVANRKAAEEAFRRVKDGLNDSGRRTRSALEHLTALEATLTKCQEEEQLIMIAMNTGNSSATVPTPLDAQKEAYDSTTNASNSMHDAFDGRQQKQEEIEIHIPPELLESAKHPIEIDDFSSDLSSSQSSSSVRSVLGVIHSPYTTSIADPGDLQMFDDSGEIPPLEPNHITDSNRVLAKPPADPEPNSDLQLFGGASAIPPIETNLTLDFKRLPLKTQTPAPEPDSSGVFRDGVSATDDLITKESSNPAALKPALVLPTAHQPIQNKIHIPESTPNEGNEHPVTDLPLGNPPESTRNVSQGPIPLTTDSDMDVDTKPVQSASTHEAAPCWTESDKSLGKRRARSPTFSMQMEGINHDSHRDRPAYPFGPNKPELLLPGRQDHRELDVNMGPWAQVPHVASGSDQTYQKDVYMQPVNEQLTNLHESIPDFYSGPMSTYMDDIFIGLFLVTDQEYPGSITFQRNWGPNAYPVPDPSRAEISRLLDERDYLNARLTGLTYFLPSAGANDVQHSSFMTQIDAINHSLQSIDGQLATAGQAIHQSFSSQPPPQPPINVIQHFSLPSPPTIPTPELLATADMPSARNPPPAADYTGYETDSDDDVSARAARLPGSETSEVAIQTLHKRMEQLRKLDEEMTPIMTKELAQSKSLSPKLFAKLQATRLELNSLSAKIESLAGTVNKPTIERKTRKARSVKTERPTRHEATGSSQGNVPPVADSHPIAPPIADASDHTDVPDLAAPIIPTADPNPDVNHGSAAPPIAISLDFDDPYVDPCILDPSLIGLARRPGTYLMSLDTARDMYPPTGCENEKYPFWEPEAQAAWDAKADSQIQRYCATGQEIDGLVRRTIRHVDTVAPQAAQTTYKLALHIHKNGSGNYVCRYHARTKSLNKWFDGNLELATVNNGCPFPGRLGTLGHPATAQPRCMHCGCYIEEVLLEFYFFKTWTIVSHRPGYANRMEGWGADYLPLRHRGMVIQAMAKHSGITISNIFCGHPNGPTAEHVRIRLVSQIEHLIHQLNGIAPAITYTLNTKLTVVNRDPSPKLQLPSDPAGHDNESVPDC